jgi:enamine deaminase RidA (YjgF/YER057c/UK114 family)
VGYVTVAATKKTDKKTSQNAQVIKFPFLRLKKRKTMTITRLGTERRRMSKIVIHNDTVYLCGQVAKDANTGIKEQTLTMLEKVDDLLQQAGSDREHILSATVYIKDMKDFAEMNEVWDAWVIEGHSPARACVEASLARPELLVEVSIIAAVKQ